MTHDHQPVYFIQACEWFIKTYGMSAEIRQWEEMRVFSEIPFLPYLKNLSAADLYVNKHWSWSNGSSDLRLYIKGEQELSLFLLSHKLS